MKFAFNCWKRLTCGCRERSADLANEGVGAGGGRTWSHGEVVKLKLESAT